MRAALRALLRPLLLTLLAFGSFFAAALALVLTAVVYVLGLVASCGLAGALISMAGWLALGSVEALHAAGLFVLVGGAALAVMMVLFDAIATLWTKVRGSRVSADEPFLRAA